MLEIFTLLILFVVFYTASIFIAAFVDCYKRKDSNLLLTFKNYIINIY